MRDKSIDISRGIGWLLFLAGLLAAVGIVGHELFVESGLSAWEMFVAVAVYGGLALLLFSVLRQRLVERKSDRYKDVEL